MTGMIHTRALGRVEITREALAALLGLPHGSQADIHYKPEMDLYNIVIRTPVPLEMNGQTITQEVMPGCLIPLVSGEFMNRNMIVMAAEEDNDNSLREAIELQKLGS